jgi:hypothetical protein
MMQHPYYNILFRSISIHFTIYHIMQIKQSQQAIAEEVAKREATEKEAEWLKETSFKLATENRNIKDTLRAE